jgi:hypothetical protein
MQKKAVVIKVLIERMILTVLLMLLQAIRAVVVDIDHF